MNSCAKFSACIAPVGNCTGKKREELRIESKLRAIARGTLRVLELQPAMRVEFLAELTARADSTGQPLKAPLKLFANLSLTAKALQRLKSPVSRKIWRQKPILLTGPDLAARHSAGVSCQRIPSRES
jgi:hypothetical protein